MVMLKINENQIKHIIEAVNTTYITIEEQIKKNAIQREQERLAEIVREAENKAKWAIDNILKSPELNKKQYECKYTDFLPPKQIVLWYSKSDEDTGWVQYKHIPFDRSCKDNDRWNEADYVASELIKTELERYGIKFINWNNCLSLTLPIK